MVASALIGAGASILGGILGGRSQRKAERRNAAAAAQARQNELEDFRTSYQRTREAAELGGFNPLTAVMTGGQGSSVVGGGTFQGHTAPLASIQMITGGIADAASAFSSEAVLRRKTDQLRYDLAKVQLDQLKAEVKASNAVQRVAGSMPSLGNQPRKTVTQALEVATTPQEITQAPDGSLAEGLPNYLDVYSEDGSQMTRIPHVEVEGEGLVVGATVAAKHRLDRSTAYQQLKKSIPLIGNIGSFVNTVLNPETFELPNAQPVFPRLYIPGLGMPSRWSREKESTTSTQRPIRGRNPR